MLRTASFTFGTYKIDTAHSIVTFTYTVKFKSGIAKTFTDKLFLKDLAPSLWGKVPSAVLESTLQALLIMIGINYWCVFPTSDIRIEGFRLTREQAQFWDSIYLNGLAEFFYEMKIDFRKLIAFPYDESFIAPESVRFERPVRALLLNGAGKDSILSAEILKASNTPFDFFTSNPTPAHKRIGKLVGVKTISVDHRRDPWIEQIELFLGVSGAYYLSVSTFTFIATLLAELLGYNSIVFSNERSADFGNLTYLGLLVNHQWCKSSEAENLVNEYIHRYITPDISTGSLLREYSELEIVRRFVQYPKYFHDVTSCNTYFYLPRYIQRVSRTPYWCNRCAKCVFLFACYAAFLPKKQMIEIFGADLYAKKRLLPAFKRILGIEGFKPLDCVGEPEEMILAMHLAARGGEYASEPAMKLLEEHFSNYDFDDAARRVLADENLMI